MCSLMSEKITLDLPGELYRIISLILGLLEINCECNVDLTNLKKIFYNPFLNYWTLASFAFQCSSQI